MDERIAKMLDSSAKVHNLQIPGDESQLSKVRDFVSEVCREAGFSPRETNNTKLAVDEACTNIIKHAYATRKGDIKIRVVSKPGSLDISIFDTGKKFDFASIKDPDLEQYVESGRKGGFGVFLINRLMDDVRYRTTEAGNELVLSKRSQAAAARAVPGRIEWRESLRFKFMLRASLGLFLLMGMIGTFTIVHQTKSMKEQEATQWMERRRLAANLSNRSKDSLIKLESYSVEQTNLSSYLVKLIDNNDDLAYAHVVNNEGVIVSSSNVDTVYTRFVPSSGEVLLVEQDETAWKRLVLASGPVREISLPVKVREENTSKLLTLGHVYLGVYEDAVAGAVKDPRPMTALLLVGIFALGILLIILLVSIFVKPIQALTDGVRAIGEGKFDSRISVKGPAEIGAIASVFNEITEKFKKAQDSILEQEKLQKEMEVAKEIQQSLLPKKMPDVSGYDIAPLYQAAAEVGGDYYDFVEVDDDTIGVVVADVSGKGVPGSLVMTMIRTALRMEARGNKNASDVMAKMNEFVTDDMRKGMFVTMFYVILDSKNRIISYASAGHNPMILYRAESNETFFLNPRGFPVGINLPDEELFRRSINVEKIKLKKDDMLLIYTDGVTEAMNENREQYGEERLIEVIKRYGNLHPREFIKRLEEDIRDFTGGVPQHDDITIVAVKEKLTADDVLFGIRKRLIELVDREGVSVREACRMMKVSPATYYRYKKRLELLGERGLRNKVLRQDVELKRMSLEDRKKMLEIIRRHPEYGAKRITEELNKIKEATKELSERIVYEELKRLNLNTKQLRLEYLRRYKLVPGEEAEEAAAEERRRAVEEFLREVAKERHIEEEEAVGARQGVGMTGEETLVSVEQARDDITVLHVHGHLDSVSTAEFEKRVAEVIGKGHYKLAVDLSRVSYISSGGWGIFTGEVKKLRERGGDVVLVGMMPEVYDVYDLLGFKEILAAFGSVDEAALYFEKSPEERLALKIPSETGPIAGMEAGMEESVPGESYVPEWESLKIEASTVGEKGEVAVLSLSGIIDTVSAGNLRKAIDRVISGGINKIVVDMSQVEYVSSGGWGTFTERLREVRRAGGDIKLFGMDPDVYYVFTMLGFNIVLSSFDIMADAIEDFGSKPKREYVMPSTSSEEDRLEVLHEELEEEPVEEDISEVFEAPVGFGESDWVSVAEWEEIGADVLCARLSGEIEASVVERLNNEVGYRVSRSTNLLLFDLSAVTYVSSAGWGALASYHEKLAAWGGRVALCGLRPELFDIYSCLELHNFIESFTSLDDAMAAWHGSRMKRKEVEKGPPEPIVPAEEDHVAPSEEGEAADREIRSIDDILGADEEKPVRESTESPIGSVAEEGKGEAVFDPEEARKVRVSRSLRDDLIEESSSEEGPKGGSIVDGPAVNLEDAVEAEEIEVDRKIRRMGWEKYGERLRKAVEKGAGKKDKE